MKIKFIRNYVTSRDEGKTNTILFKKDATIEIPLNKINLLVGDNGAGKTTIINFFANIERRKRMKDRYYIIENKENKKQIIYFETEGFRVVNGMIDSRANLRKQELNNYSHGESWNKIIDKIESIIEKNGNNVFVFLDEPETALSLDSTIKFCAMINRLKKKYPDFGAAIATHSLILAEIIGERIIEIPSGKIIPPSVYLNSQKQKIEEAKKIRGSNG